MQINYHKLDLFLHAFTQRRETHLSSVGQEEGRGKVSSDTTKNVNDGDAHPTSQLLQVSQYGHLKHY